MTISKDNRHVYVVNEKGNSVTYYDFDDAKGILTALQIIPSLPETYTGQGQASAVLLSPSEEFLYETNRIHESVAIYRVNKETGFLTNLALPLFWAKRHVSLPLCLMGSSCLLPTKTPIHCSFLMLMRNMVI